MGDTKIVYDEKFGIATFKREISDEVLAFIKENPKMLAPVRE